ncbi:hypothetical protein VTO42DRAFT_916 [Malbranchea cinnamomea]
MSEANSRDRPPHGNSAAPDWRSTHKSSVGQVYHTNPRSQSSTRPDAHAQEGRQAPVKRRHRGPKRRRHRRQSFAAPPHLTSEHNGASPEEFPEEMAASAATSPTEARRLPLYKLGQVSGNLSETSLDSQALLDHRNQPLMRPRRESRLAQSYRPEFAIQLPSATQPRQYASRVTNAPRREGQSEDESDHADDRTPLIKPSSVHNSQFARYGSDGGLSRSPRHAPRPGTASSSLRSPGATGSGAGRSPVDATWSSKRDYDVNNPPSVPGSPQAGPEMGYDDALITGLEFERQRQEGDNRTVSSSPRDAVIDIDRPSRLVSSRSRSPGSPELTRRRTVTLPAEEDVCFPTGALSEEDFAAHVSVDGTGPGERRRRRRRVWPELSVLEDWSREEKEERSGGARVKRVSEPVLVGGRLRPRTADWRYEEDDAPYRFTYFNEELPATIHSQTISELVQPGQTFKDLFIPEPPLLEDDSDVEEEEIHHSGVDQNSHSQYTTNGRTSGSASGAASPGTSPQRVQKEKRYGPRPTFWLDVLCPTDAEMRVIAKAFGIHALTAEDIMMQEAREKVELFRHYYFLNYRTFEQDVNSPKFLEPVNMYVIVFREGLISFHFSMVPHPANVRRRIRQLKDYLILSADWISYAIIDDITDVFGPLIQKIEDEVDDIDDMILRLHSDPKYISPKPSEKDAFGETRPENSALDNVPSGTDMLRRIGECRKKVMGLYRLLGNKADVIKGFAKRCNEQWEVAPKSEIGLYLGDIQDHILTMTSNLTHYETLLSRAHSNYLAQINIRMNERQEKTSDILGKLTVLGTIVLPMNIICGMWGMNVKVPGQEVDNLYWFWSITAGLVAFAVVCYLVAKRVYGIV